MTDELLDRARDAASRLSVEHGIPMAIRESIEERAGSSPCPEVLVLREARTIWVEPAHWRPADGAETVEVVGLTDANRAEWLGRIA